MDINIDMFYAEIITHTYIFYLYPLEGTRSRDNLAVMSMPVPRSRFLFSLERWVIFVVPAKKEGIKNKNKKEGHVESTQEPT